MQGTDAMTTDLDLIKFKALSFDCYGTLIDWEAGIAAVLAPWAREQGLDLSDEDLLLAYADNEAAVERETPTALYPDVLATAFRRTGNRLQRPVSDEWAQRLGSSVPDWPAFPDSVDALARLAKHHQLIILSNVHRAGFAGSNQRLHGDFAAIITAEDVGAYKPAENHFRALDTTLSKLGVGRTELLHVAQSLFHDHVPAKREGLPSVWINRRHDRPGWGATPEPAEQWTYNLAFNSMADFANAVDQAFNNAQRTNG
jgi:2-haloacid dehalogenase